ncbi:MAG: flagellar motor switch protein FliN [Gammaproteobacteria bacterium]|nr:flagellar motor switch protein FliN [Gammaproteobacteria bacterium]
MANENTASIESDDFSENADVDQDSASAGNNSSNFELVMDIPVVLSMEIGQTRMTIGEVLKLGKGSIVELQRMADEPLDVLVNGTLVAHGEAVVIGERFGIRLTDVISTNERLNKIS